MPVVSRSSLIITANSDAEVDDILCDLMARRDEQAEVYVSVSETSRELER